MSHPTTEIEIRVRHSEQLFDALDPSPFREKALKPEFDAYLRDSAGEHPPGAHLCLSLRAPPALLARAADIEAAVHGHFRFALDQLLKQTRASQRRYRGVVIVGFLVLAASLLLRRLLEGWQNAGSELLLEGLLVLGWVALWRPIEVLLFERAEARQRRQILERLARIEFTWHEDTDPDAPG